MKRKILLAVIIPILLVACSSTKSSIFITSKESSSIDVISSEDVSSNISSENISSKVIFSSQREEKSDEIIDNTYRLYFDSILLRDENNEPILLSQDFKKEDLSFDHDSIVFNKKLAFATLPFVINAPYLDKITNVFNFYGFDNLLISNEYELDETEETLLYVIGHKKYTDYDLINITVSGYNYLKPWKENFIIGQSGNHQGFNKMAMKLFPVINNYLANYQDCSNLKVYINGYSRSAAIANLTSALLIDSNLVKQENLYAYLFETPQGLDAFNNKEYNSIFNIINSADLITYVAPKEYNLKRAGKDIEIYQNNADEIIKSYHEKLNLVPFTPVSGESGYQDDVEFVNYILNYLLEEVDDTDLDKPSKDISTRENFVNNVQNDTSYLMTFFFSLPSEVLNAITDSVSQKETSELISLLQEDGLYNFLKPILDEYQVSYVEEELKTSLNNLLYLLQQKPALLFMLMSDEYRNNLLRVIYFHTLETVVPLLYNL